MCLVLSARRAVSCARGARTVGYGAARRMASRREAPNIYMCHVLYIWCAGTTTLLSEVLSPAADLLTVLLMLH